MRQDRNRAGRQRETIKPQITWMGKPELRLLSVDRCLSSHPCRNGREALAGFQNPCNPRFYVSVRAARDFSLSKSCFTCSKKSGKLFGCQFSPQIDSTACIPRRR